MRKDYIVKLNLVKFYLSVKFNFLIFGKNPAFSVLAFLLKIHFFTQKIKQFSILLIKVNTKSQKSILAFP